jgi:radical SAM-linked protein
LQMLSLFQRVCVRLGINVRYTQGFNPRPRISLPLPRPVGVESDDELLVLAVDGEPSPDVLESERWVQQLPEGCEPKFINIVREKPSFQPCCAIYRFTLKQEYMNKNLKKRINQVMSSESLVIERSIDKTNSTKKIDIRGFLISTMIEQNCIIIEYRISSAGSIRVQEIMQLLDLNTEILACPIKRTNVHWQDIWQEKC